jgi:Host cell surface-exposed lipoprotein
MQTPCVCALAANTNEEIQTMTDQYPQPGPYSQPGPDQQYQQPRPGFRPPGKRRHPVRNVLLSVVTALIAFIALGAVLGSGGSSKTPASTVTTPVASSPAATSPAPAAPQYTAAEAQAIQAARQYLAMGSGFSYSGLVGQLDSASGSGFSRALALFAVRHITVNWDHQAVLAARAYMKLGGFSYNDMVQQLDSSAGDGFTYAQAVYGAKSVGL